MSLKVTKTFFNLLGSSRRYDLAAVLVNNWLSCIPNHVLPSYYCPKGYQFVVLDRVRKAITISFSNASDILNLSFRLVHSKWLDRISCVPYNVFAKSSTCQNVTSITFWHAFWHGDMRHWLHTMLSFFSVEYQKYANCFSDYSLSVSCANNV